MSICSTASSQGYRCKVEDYGSSCGPTLTAACKPTGNTYRASLSVEDAKPDSKLIMMIGVQKTNLPLSWIFLETQASCHLLLLPVFIQQHNPNAAGKYTFARALPANSLGTGHAQFLELQSNGTVLATNGASIIAY
ncbi:MAG: hypothetical protein ACYTGW_05345 [Planctomycetota bacterium]